MTENFRNQRVPDARVIRKIVISILFGGLTYLITFIARSYVQDPIWGIMLSVVIGGIVLIVEFMVDIEHRLGDFEKEQAFYSSEIRLQIEEAFAKMNSATELFWAVEESDLQTVEAMQLLRNTTRIAPDSAPLVSSFAHSQIRHMSQFLKELGEGGSVICDGEDRDWMLGLTMQSLKTIDATSLSSVDAGGSSFGGGLWTSDLGQRYLELQRLAVEKRGVQIRRVFVILDGHGQASDEAFQRIYLQHKEQGIQTRVLEQSQIGDEFKPLLYDFVVFDAVVSYEVTPASFKDARGPSIVKTQLVLNPEQVRERMGRFERLWESAREI